MNKLLPLRLILTASLAMGANFSFAATQAWNPGGGISGVVSGPGSLTKVGPGTLALAAADTYTGGTVVSAGSLQLTGTLAAAPLSVGPGAAFDMTSTGAAAITMLLLKPAPSNASGPALILQGGSLRLDLGDNNSADQILLQNGAASVGGKNYLRLNTGSSIALGASTLISAPRGNLTGSFQFDGANTLLSPAFSQIRRVGSGFLRLSLQNSSTTEQVVVTAAPANVINIMPLGSSSTRGLGGDPALTGGGYRSQLYQALVNDGRFTPNFIGSQNVNVAGSTPAGYDVLLGANEIPNEGHSGYTTSDLMKNLNADAGTTGNNGGFWLKPDNGMNPDYITLNIGGNDYTYNHGETTGPVDRVDAIITTIQTALRPNAHLVVSNLFFRPDSGAYSDAQFNPRIQGVIFNHVLAGHHVSFGDAWGALTPNDSVALMGGPDLTHPSVTGYPVYGNMWFNAIVYGSAFWIGGQDGRWSTVNAGGLTNFAQNYQRTTRRLNGVDASTDVYFNNNAGDLPTTLGQDASVRSLNFAAGATGTVTVGGTNTLTIGVGGITLQNGAGAQTVSSNVALAATQTWGNVSSNPLTVSGSINGACGLTATGSYHIRAQVGTSNSTTLQTCSGTGAIVLSGANTYSGGTTVTGGKLIVGNTSGSGTGSGGVSVLGGGVLTDNGRIGGAVTVAAGGLVNGNGVFDGAVNVNNSGVFSAVGTVDGTLTVDTGGSVTLSGGTLTANGGVLNHGTIRLRRSAALVAGNDGTFANRSGGILDIITGSANVPTGIINDGRVIFDCGAIKVKSVNLGDGALSVTIDGYSGHTYQLQRSDTWESGGFSNVGAAQAGVTGSVLGFADCSPSPSQGFYRVQVDP